ncbi:hypothetical protein LTR95_005988 [Oleoguttula sp. CCFEE 5521]
MAGSPFSLLKWQHLLDFAATIFRRCLFPAPSRDMRYPPQGPINHLTDIRTGSDGIINIIQWRRKGSAQLCIYIHGRGRSANRSIDFWDDGTPEMMRLLATFEPSSEVYGINLPGYETSTLSNNDLANAELDTIVAAEEVAKWIKTRKRKSITIVGQSIGAYFAARLSSYLPEAHLVLVTPLASLLEIKYLHIPSCIVRWLASAAYPCGIETNCFDVRKVLDWMSSNSLPRSLVVFDAKDDQLMGDGVGNTLVTALGRGHVITMGSKKGHASSPTSSEWQRACKLREAA